MIRFKLKDVLHQRGWTAYRFAKETGISLPRAYRLAKRTSFDRLETETLDLLCRLLDCQVGDLLEYVPDRKQGRGRESRAQREGKQEA